MFAPRSLAQRSAALQGRSRDMLQKLQEHLSVAEWQAKQQTRAAVQSTIRFTLNELPDEPYPEPLWNEKVDAVWSFIFSRRAGKAFASECEPRLTYAPSLQASPSAVGEHSRPLP